MRARPLIWITLGVICLVGVLAYLRLAHRPVAKPPSAEASTPAPSRAHRGPTTNSYTVAESTAPAFLAGQTQAAGKSKPDPLAHRLSNTPKTAGQLLRDDHAILLENALIDTSRPLGFAIPEHLRVPANPGSYIVQARGPVDDAFRAALTSAGATMVSYIPNNAYLVRASSEAADQLKGNPQTQAVLAYEPVYKLKGDLLRLGLAEEALSPETRLNVMAFEDGRSELAAELQQRGLTVVSETKSPFGPVFTVQLAEGQNWISLAQLPSVEIIELAPKRIAANDLSRARVGVATDTVTNVNYLNLTGTNVLVVMNDSGVSTDHPDLVGRVRLQAAGLNFDPSGHGTHVAGIIAGDGAQSLTVTNAKGSINPGTNNQYRGMAPGARIYLQSWDNSDQSLQEGAARTNALISNNSWSYDANTYGIAASSYDAAVRDSLAGVTGSQPVLYVFAGGNAGNGGDLGLGGDQGSILSPGTAKNVITVGAVELSRDITNVVTKISDGVTNTTTPWAGMTSSGNQVAGFSSRGNVGIGIEGDFGRYKPDLVAPGTFVISTRSTTWDEAAYYNPTSHHVTTFSRQVVPPTVTTNGFDYYGEVPLLPNAVGFALSAFNRTNVETLDPVARLPLFVRQVDYPILVPATYDFVRTNFVSVPPDAAGIDPATYPTWFFAVGNSLTQSVSFDLIRDIVTTNDNGDQLVVQSNLNNSISGTAPHYYRYESGTSMSAADVSGTLALMQQFFQERGVTNSPALMKALLINGARRVGDLYDFQVQNTLNYQGWGLVKLNNALPGALTNGLNTISNSIFFFDQSPTNALATGQRHTRLISVSPGGRTLPLRVSLVWTDPPGNPAAGVKLVNDLDLVVTNLDNPASPIVYHGNEFQANDEFSVRWDPLASPEFDSVNNVENVYIDADLGTNYSISVLARRVNINAVTAHTNNVVQDYALVISSGDGEETNALGLATSQPLFVATNESAVTIVSNLFVSPTFSTASLINQRVGANSPLLGTTNGVTNQWRFYIVTNSTPFTNAAFLVNGATDLGLPRMGVFQTGNPLEATRRFADVDLYVTTNHDLLVLDPVAVDLADKSRTRNARNGDEAVIYTNSVQNRVYYIGVKSEDYEAVQYELAVVFSLRPLGDEEGDGFIPAYPLLPPQGYIPDGSPAFPGASKWITYLPTGGEIRRVIVTNQIIHEKYADLVSSVVSPSSKIVILNNHRTVFTPPSPGPYGYVYEDNDEGYPGAIHPDGPGQLRDFVGDASSGQWSFFFVDNALTQTGRVENCRIRVERQPDNGESITNTVLPASWQYYAVNVPVGATNLTICLALISPTPGPLQVFVRKDQFPAANAYDYAWTVTPPTGALPGSCTSITLSDLPPLTPGRYYIGIYNPNSLSQTYVYTATYYLGPGVTPINWSGTGNEPILDDAVGNYSRFVTNNARIAQVEVGLRIDHPRVSDLAVTLISPHGTRVLLVENRGGTDTNGFGSTLSVTNFAPVQSTNFGPQTVTNLIDTGATAGTLNIDYDFGSQYPDQMTVYYEGNPLLDSGMIIGTGRFTLSYGPGASTQVMIIMNQFGNSETNTQWSYTVSSINDTYNYLLFTENTNKTTTPIKFAVPPFALPTTFTNVLISDFEPPLTTIGNYSAPQIVDGWSVLGTNQVTVSNNPAANTGTQSLALRSGQIERNLPTALGRSYRLNFAYLQGLPPPPPKLVSIDFGAGPINGNSAKTGVAAVGRTITDFWNFYSRGDTVWRNNGNLPNLRLVDLTPTSMGMTVLDAAGAWGNGSLDMMYNGYLYPLPNGSNPINVTFTNVPVGKYNFYVYSHNGNYELISGTVNHGIRTTFDFAAGGVNPVWQEGVQYALFPNVVVTNSTQPVRLTARPGIGDVAMIAGIQIMEVAEANQVGANVYVSGQVTNTILGTTNWLPGGLVFTAFTNSTRVGALPVQTNESRILLDTFTLTDAAGPLYVLPEESLDTLRGENARGLWQLEIWDSRTGATNQVSLLGWQMQFVFITNSPAARRLRPCDPITTSIPPGQLFYYTVDVPPTARYATNFLFNASSPLGFYFNQNAPPGYGATNAGDIAFTTGAQNLTTNLSAFGGAPLLIPGKRYYLAIENAGIANASFTLQVCFDLSELPPATNLVSGVEYCTTNINSLGIDYYLFNVSTNAKRAQFEINHPSGDMTLLVRRGLPPTFGVYDYFSANAFTNDELVTVFDFSTPVALTPGAWYLGAANLSSIPVRYCIRATEWFEYGTNIVITNWVMTTNAFCITWTSLPGVKYYVEGIADLATTNWVTASPTITGTGYTTTYCIPMPSPLHFFRVREGIALNVFVPPPVITKIERVLTGFLISWSGPTNAQYNVQWAPTLNTPPPLVWTTFANPATVTSLTGLFQFLDTGAETGGFGPMRFYRLILLP